VLTEMSALGVSTFFTILSTVSDVTQQPQLLLQPPQPPQPQLQQQQVGVEVNTIVTRSSATAKSTARPSCLVGIFYDILSGDKQQINS